MRWCASALVLWVVSACAAQNDRESNATFGRAPTPAEVELSRGDFAKTDEEAFTVDGIRALAAKSARVLFGNIESVSPGPTELLVTYADGTAAYDATMAIVIVGRDGTRQTFVQDFADEIEFGEAAKRFPVGADAIVFAASYTSHGPEKAGNEFTAPPGVTMWQPAHPLAFWVVDSEGGLSPLFVSRTTTPIADADADMDFLNERFGVRLSAIRWPALFGS